MQAAIDAFFCSPVGLFQKMVFRLESHCSDFERESHFVLRELATALLAQNPLFLSGTKHYIFWQQFKQITGYCQAEFEESDSDPTARYAVRVDTVNELRQMSYFFALAGILRTLVDPRFHKMVNSVNCIPQHIVVAFMQRAGLRAYMLDVILANAEDQLDVNMMFRSGMLSFTTFEELMAEQYERNTQHPDHTPLRQLDLHEYSPPTDLESNEPTPQALLSSFPERCMPNAPLQLPGQLIAAPLAQTPLLVGIYTYTWSEVCEVVDSVRTALRAEKHCHSRPDNECRCESLLFSMDTLMALVHAFVTQSFDLKTLDRPLASYLFRSEAVRPLLIRLERIANTVTDYLLGRSGETSPLPAYISRYETVVAKLLPHIYGDFAELSAVQQQLTDTLMQPPVGSLQWQCLRVEELPVQVLLDAVDIRLALAYWSVKLRKFLEHKSRALYSAYLLPRNTNIADLERTLALLRQLYGSFWPELFDDLCSVALHGALFIVCQPQRMVGLRLLMLLETVLSIPQRTDPIGSFSSNIFFQAFITEYPVDAIMLREISTYAVVKSLAFFLGGSQLAGLVATPNDKVAFAVYRHLPALLDIAGYPHTDGSVDIVRSFLALKTRHILDLRASTELLNSLEHGDLLGACAAFSVVKKIQRQVAARRPRYFLGSATRPFSPKIAQLYELLFSEQQYIGWLGHFAILTGFYACRNKPPSPCAVPVSQSLIEPAYEHRYVAALQPRWSTEVLETHVVQRFEQLCRGDCNNLRRYSVEEMAQLAATHSDWSRYATTGPVNTTLTEPQLYGLNYSLKAAEWKWLTVPVRPNKKWDESVNMTPMPMPTVRIPSDGKADWDLLPLLTEPRCYFENAFFLKTNSVHWPRELETSTNCILSANDKPVLDVDILKTLAVQYSNPWRPGNLLSNIDFDDRLTYVECIVKMQDYMNACD